MCIPLNSNQVGLTAEDMQRVQHHDAEVYNGAWECLPITRCLADNVCEQFEGSQGCWRETYNHASRILYSHCLQQYNINWQLLRQWVLEVISKTEYVTENWKSWIVMLFMRKKRGLFSELIPVKAWLAESRQAMVGKKNPWTETDSEEEARGQKSDQG